MAFSNDVGSPCLNCIKCPGFKLHKWRLNCLECECKVTQHYIIDSSGDNCLEKMGFKDHPVYASYTSALTLAHQHDLQWLPIGLQPNDVQAFLIQQSPQLSQFCKNENNSRLKAFRIQIPIQDRSSTDLRHADGNHLEKSEIDLFMTLRSKVFGVGTVDKSTESQACQGCQEKVDKDTFCVHYQHIDGRRLTRHLHCFKCACCEEILVDFIYFLHSNKLYCERHFAENYRVRCADCGELIFAKTYTDVMDQEHHSEHFACKHCDKSLTGQRYILKDEHPYCLTCYEEVFANSCEQCKEKIGCDSKDLSFKERHWHEKCFNCSACNKTLVDQPFATRDEALFCSNCHDEKFAARCDACNNVFKAGMRKFEYRGKQWHEECFTCSECQQPIGSKSFIPCEQQMVCVPCYENKYAQKCTKCLEVIRRGGVTYKSEPWHKECFTCNHCNKQLAGIKFISKDEKPYCADCYGELFAKKCCKCSKPITGIGGCKFISFEDRHWHSECFNCSKCDMNLVGKGFLTADDQITCPDCGR